MMDFYQDGVNCFLLPDEAHCELDEEQTYILDLDKCPNGHEYCSGDCIFYSEDKTE